MSNQFWIAPILPANVGPREWANDVDEAAERACQFSRETGHDYEVYERAAYVTPHTLEWLKPDGNTDQT